MFLTTAPTAVFKPLAPLKSSENLWERCCIFIKKTKALHHCGNYCTFILFKGQIFPHIFSIQLFFPLCLNFDWISRVLRQNPLNYPHILRWLDLDDMSQWFILDSYFLTEAFYSWIWFVFSTPFINIYIFVSWNSTWYPVNMFLGIRIDFLDEK